MQLEHGANQSYAVAIFACIAVESGTVLYTSEAAHATVNPVWLPIEWPASLLQHQVQPQQQPQQPSTQHASTAAETRQQAALKESVCRIRLYAHSDDKGGRLRHAEPRYYPAAFPPRAAEPAVSSSRAATTGVAASTAPASDSSSGSQPALSIPGSSCSDVLLLDVTADLRNLHFFGFDVAAVLAQNRVAGPAKGGSARERESIAAAGSDMPADTAAYHLDALPLNTLILQLEDGHYTTPDRGRLMLKDGGASIAAMATSAVLLGSPVATPRTPLPPLASTSLLSPSAPAAKLDLRRAFDAINRLMQLQRDINAADSDRATAAERMAMHAAGHPIAAAVHASDSELLAATLRVQALRRLREEAAADAAAAEAAVAERRVQLAVRTAGIKDSAATIRDTSQLLPGMNSEIELVRCVMLLACLVLAFSLFSSTSTASAPSQLGSMCCHGLPVVYHQ